MIQPVTGVARIHPIGMGLKVRTWFALFATLPVIYFLYWPSVYALYGIVLLAGAYHYARIGRFPRIHVPIVIRVKFALMLALLFLYADSVGNILNIGGVVFVEVFSLWFMTDAVSDKIRSKFFRVLARACILNIVIYFLISVMLSRFVQIQNPIEDFLAGERVRLLAFQTGHSILIDLSFIALIIAVSNIGKLKMFEIISIVVISTFSVLVAKSAGGYLLLVCVAFVFAIEALGIKGPLKILLYVPFFLGILIFFLQPDLLNDALYYLRSDLQGVSISRYSNGDLSAGRALLNDMLSKVISDSPWIGVGHEDPVIQYGTNIYSDQGLSAHRSAITESGLRNAAQYGIPYFFCVVAFILQPLLVAFRSGDRALRVFCQSLSFGLLTLLAVNSQFEVPHEPQHFIYFSLLALSIQFGREKEPSARKAPVRIRSLSGAQADAL